MTFLLILAIIVFAFIFLYNSIITLKNRTEEAWSGIDVQLKRRYDLIPNLVETVKGYAKQEQDVFVKVTTARSAAMGAGTVAEQARAENALKETLKSLFAVAENYPELKSNQNFLDLQSQLQDTENKIEASRRFYNGNVRDFNTKIQVFPNNIIANMLGFKNYDFYDLEGNPEQRENVKVQFTQGIASAAPAPAEHAEPAKPVEPSKTPTENEGEQK